jgi:hypothetical protein
VYVVRLIVATSSSGPPASGKIIKEMPGSVASGTSYITSFTACHNIVRDTGATKATEAYQNNVFVLEASQTHTVTAKHKFSYHSIVYILTIVVLSTKSDIKHTLNK